MVHQEDINVFDFLLEDFIDVGHIWNWFCSFIDDEAWASFIREVFNAFGWDDFHKFHMRKSFGDIWQMEIDELTKLIAVLVQMQDNEIFRVDLSDFSDELCSWDFNNFTIFFLGCFNFDFFHSIGHILPGKLIIKI